MIKLATVPRVAELARQYEASMQLLAALKGGVWPDAGAIEPAYLDFVRIGYDPVLGRPSQTLDGIAQTAGVPVLEISNALLETLITLVGKRLGEVISELKELGVEPT